MAKYEILNGKGNEKIIRDSDGIEHTLHRIRRLSDGKLGGWIENEKNLSQEGDCFVSGEAMVWGDAQVSGDAQVYGGAHVYGDAHVCGHARVYENARVYGNAQVYENAEVSGRAKVSGEAKVFGGAKVYNFAQVYGDAEVCENAQVHGSAKVYGGAKVWGDAQVYDDAQVYNAARVCFGARVFGCAQVYGHAQVRGRAEVYGGARVYGGAKVWGDAQVYDFAQVYGGAQVYERAQVCGFALVSRDAQVFGKTIFTGIVIPSKYMKDNTKIQEAIQQIKREFKENSNKYGYDIAVRISNFNGEPLSSLYGALFRFHFPNEEDYCILKEIEDCIKRLDNLDSDLPITSRVIASKIGKSINELSVEEKNYMKGSFEAHGQSLYKALNDYSKGANLGDIFREQLSINLENTEFRTVERGDTIPTIGGFPIDSTSDNQEVSEESSESTVELGISKNDSSNSRFSGGFLSRLLRSFRGGYTKIRSNY